MIYLQYLFLAAFIVYATLRLSYYVDVIDKRTTLSSALLGGVLLAFITSLPELITSLTSTIYLNESSYAFGNVFGSNLFNLLIIAGVDLFFLKQMALNKVRGYFKLNMIVLAMYLSFLIPMGLRWMGLVEDSFFQLNLGIVVHISTLLIIGLYVFSLKDLYSPETKTQRDDSALSMNQVVSRFLFWALVVVSSSVFITTTTDQIASALNLNASFAGAIFLGIATSLPELTAVIALFRLKNYSVAMGNVIGSNAFNFLIIAVVDLALFNQSIFTRATLNVSEFTNITWLLLFGALSTIILSVALRVKWPKKLYMVPSLLIFIVYGIYLFNSL
jgi:cation:H+ antiporter